MQVVELGLAALDERYGRLRVADGRREARVLASIEEHGQQDAILVVAEAEGRFVVIDGHKRVRALRRLRRDVVKAVVLEAVPAEALAAAYRAESGPGRSAIEEGWLVYELHRVGKWDLGRVAAAMERSKSWASRRLGLVEELPDAVLEGVRRGALGSWSAMKHLLPLARANAPACERLAEKIMEAELTSRQVALVCEHLGRSGAAARERILEDPARFLKALDAAARGALDPALSQAENRVLKQLELVGNVALGLTRNLPEVLGYDAGASARAALWPAWDKTAKRLALLEEAAEGLRAAQGKNTEEEHAQPGSTDGDLDVARAGPRQPQDRGGLGSQSDGGQGSAGQRTQGGIAVASGASA